MNFSVGSEGFKGLRQLDSNNDNNHNRRNSNSNNSNDVYTVFGGIGLRLGRLDGLGGGGWILLARWFSDGVRTALTSSFQVSPSCGKSTVT